MTKTIDFTQGETSPAILKRTSTIFFPRYDPEKHAILLRNRFTPHGMFVETNEGKFLLRGGNWYNAEIRLVK